MTDVPDTPAGRLDPRYSDPTAGAPPWTEVERLIAEAELFWISTVRPDGRPHVTPLPAVWSSGALHFCTGPEERKARNLAENPHAVFTTGVNTWARGYDVVVEGRAERVRDDARLRGLAALWEEKYGDFWHFDVRDGHFHHGAGRALVFSVAPHTVFGFVDALPA
ncbi:pyridoxamine 5'-phosphate oxidase family protein [Streptomyces griseoincarnatus]